MSQNGKSSFGRRTTAPASVDPGDKRRSRRSAAFKPATVVLADQIEIDCIARNISADGCLVTVVGAEHFPDTIILRLGPAGAPQAAQVVWRGQGEAGLKFV